ncbi:hypothetical protein OAN38_01060 [Candidatus Marinimicrobia bacterium]|nr:hypothetical protein [Candidatus Neomarinimicrobiota bacterium]MDC0383411.1 hypothetical protein [Candidatus Neomarinimicrobiota bacterium]
MIKSILLVFLTFLFICGCEIKNSPIEILSIDSSDSVAFSNEIIKLYVDVEDGDGDKISYSWGSSGGDFTVKKDTAFWTAPNQSGYYNISCKVSDGVGSSDAMHTTIRVHPLTPVPVNGLDWNLNDTGLMSGPNSSNESKNGTTDYWDGLTENSDFGWNISLPDQSNGEVSQSLLFKVEDSANCGGNNPNEQKGKATANIQINGDTPITLDIQFSGIGEAQSAGYDLIEFSLNGVIIGSGEAPGGGLGCTSDSVTVNPAEPQILNPGAHSLVIDFTTNDGLYHLDAFYEVNLKLIVP